MPDFAPAHAGAEPAPTSPTLRFKRRRHVTASWVDDHLELRVAATGACHAVRADQLPLLHACTRWSSAVEVAEHVARDTAEVAEALAALADASVLLRSGEAHGTREADLDGWGGWAPVASSFHFATRDQRFQPTPGPRPLMTARPQPPALKRYVDLPSQELPAFPTQGELAEALLGRRTWRSFGGGRVDIAHVAALCGLTWAVQQWACFDNVDAQAVKTSPSGGARHSVEAYVGVRDVDGLEAGIYHYAPDDHALTLLRRGLTSTELVELLAGQDWFGDAAFVVFQTSVFARVQWRYPNPRAYRNVLIETGHLAQTFLTVATHLGLAPFCTAALADTRVEMALGVDPTEESVLYAVGVGPRPDVPWAPLPAGEQRGTLVPPAHRSRLSPE